MIPRYAPEIPFPPYAFVSPFWPHPEKDPRGHSYAVRPPEPPPLDPRSWRDCRPFLHGIDLFNCGYYWEAHEAWEGLWHAAGRSGAVADLLRGLVKLAAAGVKVRQGMPRGVESHARRAADHFESVRRALDAATLAGFDLGALASSARDLAARARDLRGDATRPVEVVIPFRLEPR